MHVLKRLTAAVVASCAICVAGQAAHAADGYSIRPLGTDALPFGFNPIAVNDQGQAAGRMNGRAARAESSGAVTDLGTFSGSPSSDSFAINNLGQVVGMYAQDRVDEEPEAILFDPTTGLRSLGTLGGSVSRALGINDTGQIVGDSGTNIQGQGSHAFRLDPGGVMRDLGTLGGSYSSARAINNAGLVVGESNFSPDLPFTAHAFRTDVAGVMHDLGTLGGTFSRANAINAAGDAVGYAATAGDAVAHAFLAPAAGGLIDLGTLSAGQSSIATGLNDAGLIVGNSFSGTSTPGTPFLYANGHMADLNTLLAAGSGWTLLEARDINNLGQIVGIGDLNGETRAFLLTPVPEPAGLLLIGIAACFIVRRRRK
jgi:probable HAF family extracellular repeat protein